MKEEVCDADETGQVFASTHTVRLNDVFGIRVGSFEEPEALNELSRKLFKENKIELTYKGKSVITESSRVIPDPHNVDDLIIILQKSLGVPGP